METPKTYDEIRPSLRTGMALLSKGRGIVSGLIRLWTTHSHAALILRLEKYAGLRNRVFLVEALPEGVRPTLLSERILDGGTHYIFQPEGLTPDAERLIRMNASISMAQRTGYDYKGLFFNALGRVSVNASRYFCSEYVWLEWYDAGVLNRETLTDDGLRLHRLNRAPRPGDLPKWLRGTITEVVR